MGDDIARPADQATHEPSPAVSASGECPSRICGLYRDKGGTVWFCATRTYVSGPIVRCEGQSGPSADYFTAVSPNTFTLWGWTPCDSDEHPKGEDAERLSGEVMPARAEGIAQGPVS